jgi:hypothetical protein
MSKNINQVYMTNPITSNAATDLMYFGQSPYAANDDAAMTYSNFSAQFVLSTLSTHNAVLTTNASGVITPIVVTNGQVVIGNTAGAPLAATLTASTGISITNGANSITIASNGANPWVDQTTASVTMAVNTGYTSDAGASLVTFTLPATSAIGDWVEINGKGSGGYTIAQAAGQAIHYGNLTSTVGVGGFLSSSNQWDCVRLRCVTANTTWTVVSSVGNLTVA